MSKTLGYGQLFTSITESVINTAVLILFIITPDSWLMLPTTPLLCATNPPKPSSSPLAQCEAFSGDTSTVHLFPT